MRCTVVGMVGDGTGNGYVSVIASSVAVSVALFITVVLLVVRMARSKPARMDVRLVDDYSLSVMSRGRHWGFGPMSLSRAAGAYDLGSDDIASAARVMVMWQHYRRCTAFDHMYLGNALMCTSDQLLEDGYVLLHRLCTHVASCLLTCLGDVFC